MIRALVYLAAAGVIWLAEGFLFSRFLQFSAWQTVLMAVLYLGLYSAAAAALIGASRGPQDRSKTQGAWRLIAAAPMLVVIVGSFVSLPLLVAILLLGQAA